MENRITRDDFSIITKGLKAAYPKDDFISSEYTFNLWYTALQAIDYPTLNRAATAYIMSNHFPPTISDIRQLAYDLTAPADDIAAEEWSKLMRALGHAGGLDAADHWEMLPDVTQEIVGSYFEFIQWSNMPTVDLMSVQRPMFIKRFEEKTKQRRLAGPLPGQLRAPTKSIEGNLPPALEDKTEGIANEKTRAPAELLARLRERLS